MTITPAAHMGLCFGVRDALALAHSLQNPTQITIFGQLVHNPLVNNALAAKGYELLEESRREETREAVHERPRVLVTAHGISNAQRQQLLAQGKQLHDATCPLVKRAHHAALQLAREGRFVLVLGKKDHVEVRGLTGDLPAVGFAVIESEAQVISYPHPHLGIIAQTTSVESHVQHLLALIHNKNPLADIRFINTICQPTRDRQQALQELLAHIDVLVVVGGHHSNNTRQLVSHARQAGVRAIHIEHADELAESLFHPDDRVGLTAGTSTLPETIREVHQRLAIFHQTTPAVCHAQRSTQMHRITNHGSKGR